jgi:hypothetical protein
MPGHAPSRPLATPAHLARRAPRPAQPHTHRIHTSNHRQSAATPPCTGTGPTSTASGRRMMPRIPRSPSRPLATSAHLARRALRPVQPPTHRIHTCNHRQSAATPPRAGPGAPRWRGAHQTRHQTRLSVAHQTRLSPTRHQTGGRAGARRPHISPNQPHSVRDASPLQKHDTSTRRGTEAGTRRQTRKKRVGGGVPANWWGS